MHSHYCHVLFMQSPDRIDIRSDGPVSADEQALASTLSASVEGAGNDDLVSVVCPSMFLGIKSSPSTFSVILGETVSVADDSA